MTKLTTIPASIMCDFYKITHKLFYPAGTTEIYSTWTPRSSQYFPIETDYAVAFGFQIFVNKYLVGYFNEHFFAKTEDEVAGEYEYVIENTLGGNVDSSHIRALHRLGYLPLEIKAVPEGTKVPMKVPTLTIRNTLPEFYWVTNYFETIMSSELWLASNSATIASHYRRILDTWALATTGTTDGVEFQGHDFSFRGMQGLDSAVSSGLGHLLSFVGTDNIPAIVGAEMYYRTKLSSRLVGTSVPATEHSIMSSFGRDEVKAFSSIIDSVPTGIVSIVSDTYDFWGVLTNVLPTLKDKIMTRDGKVVIRPDSGNPVDIICGTNRFGGTTPEEKGAIQLLWETFGGTISHQGFKVLDSHIGLLYGDAITAERATEICTRLFEKGFASTNVVFGIGSFTYSYVTRDSLGYALKATYAKINGEEVFIEKDPKTDKNNLKKSLTGKVAVIKSASGIVAVDHLNDEQEANFGGNMLRTIFKDGDIYNESTLKEVQDRLHGK